MHDEVDMELRWVDGFEVSAVIRDDTVTLSANREGPLSLANHLTDLAAGEPGDHLHLDSYNSLEDGSCELVIERCE